MKIIKVKCGDRSIPAWVVKTLKGTKKTAPYMFKAVTPDALDNLGDLAAWCQNNGSPASKVINTVSGRFIKITDPLCRELELANLVKDAEGGFGEYDESLDLCEKSNRQSDAVVAKMNAGHLTRLKQQLIDKLTEMDSLLTLCIRNVENQKNVSSVFQKDPAAVHDQLTTTRKSIQKSIRFLQ